MIFSRLDYRERLCALQEGMGISPASEKGLIPSNPILYTAMTGDIAWLSVNGEAHAGALGRESGSYWLDALAAIQEARAARLIWLGDSAGADVTEPLEGLSMANAVLEALWTLQKTCEIAVIIPRFAFGGSAVLLATTAHRILLGPQASLGLIGNRITGAKAPIPKNDIPPVHRYETDEAAAIARLLTP